MLIKGLDLMRWFIRRVDVEVYERHETYVSRGDVRGHVWRQNNILQKNQREKYTNHFLTANEKKHAKILL